MYGCVGGLLLSILSWSVHESEALPSMSIYPSIHNKTQGHVEVFAPRRRLLLEGWVHKVKFNKHEKRVEEQVRCVHYWCFWKIAAHEPSVPSIFTFHTHI